jgi:hypothetical protein
LEFYRIDTTLSETDITLSLLTKNAFTIKLTHWCSVSQPVCGGTIVCREILPRVPQYFFDPYFYYSFVENERFHVFKTKSSDDYFGIFLHIRNEIKHENFRYKNEKRIYIPSGRNPTLKSNHGKHLKKYTTVNSFNEV